MAARQPWATVGFLRGDGRITWRNNMQTLGSVSSVQVPSGGSLSHPASVSSKKGSCCWEVGEALGALLLGRNSNWKERRGAP